LRVTGEEDEFYSFSLMTQKEEKKIKVRQLSNRCDVDVSKTSCNQAAGHWTAIF